MAFDFKFPDVGEGIHSAVVSEILVKPGDKVKQDETTMFSVEQDKGVTEIPSPVSGVISAVNIKVGQTIHVGEVVIIIDDQKGASVAPAPTVKASTKKAVVEEESAPSVVGVVVTSNRVVKSRAEAPSSKATAKAVAMPSAEKMSTRQAAIANHLKKQGGQVPYLETTKAASNVAITPLAKNMADDLKVDISKIAGSGPNGRIEKADIEKYVASGSKKTDAPSINVKPIDVPTFNDTQSTRVEKLTTIRKMIAQSMSTSKTVIPETTLSIDVNVTELKNIRSQLKEKAEASGVKLTYLPFITKAITNSLAKFPKLNARIDLDKGEMIWQDFQNIGIAIDTEQGLVVPNIKSANRLSVFEIGMSIQNLAKSARDRKLSAASMKGGTFTITNYGSVGIKYGTPIINYPEVAVLGVGTIESRLALDENKIVKTENYMAFSLSIDHRLIDGADAGRFLQDFKKQLESPATLLVG